MVIKHQSNHTWIVKIKHVSDTDPLLETDMFLAYFGHKNINTLRLGQNGRHFPDDIFKSIFLIEIV